MGDGAEDVIDGEGRVRGWRGEGGGWRRRDVWGGWKERDKRKQRGVLGGSEGTQEVDLETMIISTENTS